MMIERLVQKNPVLQNLFYHILCESFFEENKFQFRHCCPDIYSRVKIGNLKTHPLQKCQCTILELILRYINVFNNNTQEALKNFFISMFNLYHFKQNLIKSYTKMFHFLYYYKKVNINYEYLPMISKFHDIDVQLFTSDILSGYVLEQKTEGYIIEYFQNKNQNKLAKLKSHDEPDQMKLDKQQSEEDTQKQREESKTEDEEQLILDDSEEQKQQDNNENNNDQQIDESDDSYETIEDDDDDDESQTNALDREFIDRVFNNTQNDEQIIYDNQADKLNQKDNYFVNEYYFGNILDKVLFFTNLSFKNKQIIYQFQSTFNHIAFISLKTFSLSKLISNDLFRTKFIEILSKLQFKINTKLKRNFQTIYQHDEYALNELEIEASALDIIKKMVCYLHTEISVDSSLFQKIHIDYMKAIIQKIYEITEQSKNDQVSDISSIHIPLHRALITFIMSYFKFDFELITSQSVNKLAEDLKLQFEDFQKFIFEQLKYPLNAVSFIKEIDCGIWNFHGEYFKYFAEAYSDQYFGYCYFDTLFLQFAFKIGSTDLNQLANIFCNKQEYYDIINLKLVNNDEKMNKDFIEKSEKVVGEFLSFVIYSLVDQIALFNLTRHIFDKNSDKQKCFMKNTNMFISSYMHQFKTVSIQDVQQHLTEVFGKRADVSELLLNVSTFNTQTKKFQIMEKFGNLCEPNLFYWCPKIKSVFHDKTFEKYQNSKDIHIYLLGNLELSLQQKGILKNIINLKSFRFIEDLIKQPLISNQLENKKSIAQQYLIVPILKLILIYVENFKLFNNSKTIDTHVQNILIFLNQYKVNFGNEITNTIQFLQEQLNKSQNMVIEKQQLNEAEEDKLKKKEQIQKRQEEILNKFRQRIEFFSEINQEDLTLEKNISIGDNCVICKNSLDNNEEYGFGVYCQKTNIYEFSELKGYTQQNIAEQDQQRFLKTQAFENQFWNIKDGSWQINSCFHNIHKTCYEQYLARRNKNNNQYKRLYYQFEYNCPLCNRLLNSFLINSKKQVFNVLTDEIKVLADQIQYSQFKWDTMELYPLMIKSEEQDLIKKQMSNSEFKYKKYEINNQENNLNYLQNQIEKIESMQYSTNGEKKSKKTNVIDSLENKDLKNIDTIEKIILNELRLTDFDCTPISLISQIKKLSLMRYTLYNLNRSLNNNNTNLSSFYTKRYNFCLEFMNLLNQIQQNPSEQLLQKNLIENDLKEAYFKFLFYSINYFNSEQDFIKLIQSTINHVLLAKFVQIHVLIKNKSNQAKQTHFDQQGNTQKFSVDEISTFEDNERCQYNVDILQRTWNLLSLFFDFDQPLQSQLNRIFNDSKDEVTQLLKLLKVEIPSKEQQKQYLEKVINSEFDQNHLNIQKIVPNNTSFSFIQLENKFSDLFKKYQSVKCSNCNDFPSFGDLCICLICGEVLCSAACQDYKKDHIGNLNRHSIKFHCNSSVFLDLSNSTIAYISYPYNYYEQELYSNKFGIAFNKKSQDWSQFQLDNSLLSKIHSNVINLSIVDFIKQQEAKNGIFYRQHEL